MRVGVLMGGWSSEREISLLSGRNVAAGLREAGFTAVPVTLAKGERDEKRIGQRLRRARLDAAFVALHGGWGEDGGVQALLEDLGVPYTGSAPLSCGLAMHKACAKLVFESAQIPTARWTAVNRDELRAGAKAPKLPGAFPLVVKPAESGSAVGVSIVKNALELKAAYLRAFHEGPWALVEKFIPGTEITVGVLGRKALPVIEIVPRNAFYDYDAKYAPGGSRHLLPARIPAATRALAQRLALKAGEALGCEGYWRADFIVPRNGAPQILEVNTVPGFTSTSLFPEAAKAAGFDYPKLLKTLVALALKRSHRVKTKGRRAA